jgi:Na+/melibiose symporter-like transporter
MIKRLILFIVIFAIFLTFITFNLENKCNINFVFKVLDDVPVFLTVFISFFAGFFCALPLIFRAGKKNTDSTGKSKIPVLKEKNPTSFSGGKYFTKKNKTKDSSNDSQ